jgi:Ser/Thr protein kinase RdoA (MazF antagonist)
LQKVETILGGGYVNMNLKVCTSKGKYVIRLFLRDIEQERLDYAYSIVSKLSKVGTPALMPILNHKGLSYSRYKDYVVQVTPFIEASLFQWIPEQAYHSGQMLCKMHQVLTTVEESPKSTGIYQYYHLDPLSIMKRLKEIGHTLPHCEGSAIDDYYQLMNQHVIETSHLPMTIIHGDWNPWNQLYKENNEVRCFMDFDTLQRGERVFDVAYALYFFLIQHQNEFLGKEFLKGYGCLTQQEISILPILIAKIGLFFGIFVEYGDFQFARNKSRLEWVISEQGRMTIQGFCSRDS